MGGGHHGDCGCVTLGIWSVEGCHQDTVEMCPQVQGREGGLLDTVDI